ncbi:MAG: hypothetical protein L0312_04155 [Acidobacteria bacterium]|nr:hypothetical protein [Acidobacteriota bacterium]
MNDHRTFIETIETQFPVSKLSKESYKVLALLRERFHEWQAKGYIPSRWIEPGDETTRLMRERGWTHWHHLFTLRQLLVHGLFLQKTFELDVGCAMRTISDVGDTARHALGQRLGQRRGRRTTLSRGGGE